MVAGAAALLFANDSNATNAIVDGRLARNADSVGTSDQTGNGRLNLARAFADTSTNGVTPLGAPGGGPFVGPYASAAACSWKTTATDGNWSNGANWTGCTGTGTAPNRVPAAADDLTIPAAAASYPTLSAAGVAHTINIASGASVTVATGGTLTMAAAITDNGTLTVSGTGVLTGSQALDRQLHRGLRPSRAPEAQRLGRSPTPAASLFRTEPLNGAKQLKASPAPAPSSSPVER